MDLSRLRNPGGVTPRVSDTARLIILLVLTGIVIVSYFFFSQRAEWQKDDGLVNPDDYVEAPETVRIPGARVEPEKLLDVKDAEIADRVVKEKEPYVHLLHQASRLVYGDMDILGVKRPVPEEIRKNPAAYRGKPFEVKGILQWYERKTDLDFDLYRGYLTTYEGDYVYFTVRIVDTVDVVIGDVIKLQGFFFKLYSFELPGEDGRVNDALFLIGKRLIPSFYDLPPVTELKMELLDTLYDYTEEDITKPFEERPLYHMLSYVHNMSDETFRSMNFQELYPTEIMRTPHSYRGKPVRILGEVIWLVERNLGPEGENPVGPKNIYHGLMINYQGGFCYFLSFDTPDWLIMKDLVYIDGFFFRNYAYRTRQESRHRAPVVIVRNWEDFILPEDHTFLYISYAILAGAVIAAGIFFLYVFRDRKHSRLFREKFIARKKKLLTRVMNPEAEGESTAEEEPLTRE